MKETMVSSCFRGLKGHSDPSCTQSFGAMTILWIPQSFYRLALWSTSVSGKRPFNHWELRWSIQYMYVLEEVLLYVCPQYMYVCLSVPCCLWPCLCEWVPEITQWQINGLSWPSSLLHAALCGWPAHSSNTGCLWGSPATDQTQEIVLFSTDTHKKHKLNIY